MKVNYINIYQNYEDILPILVELFGYSIKELESYDELTQEEKKIITEDEFNLITKKSKK